MKTAIGMRAWLPIPTDWVAQTQLQKQAGLSRETRGRSTIDVEDWAATFAVTPPYEAFKLELSLMMTEPRSQFKGDGDVLMVLDLSRAHVHSPLARAVFVTYDGTVYKLLKAMYGLRDGGSSV